VPLVDRIGFVTFCVQTIPIMKLNASGAESAIRIDLEYAAMCWVSAAISSRSASRGAFQWIIRLGGT